MASDDSAAPTAGTGPNARDIFKSAPPEYQELIREFLREERDVMHLKRRSDIHQRLYEHIKRVIK